MSDIANISFRAMQESDLKAVMEIEQDVYEFPWTTQIFRDCLRVGYICKVCERQDIIVGYSIVSTGAGDAHILNLCVVSNKQNSGYGRKMLQQVLLNLRECSVDTVLLEVRPSNQAAVHLYEDMGFNRIGERRDYYPAVKGREDAWVFCINLFY
ncbi:MAG: ribosomal protein S18-alanine N-acetyltransferase [Thiohalomonadales bacterium]